MRAFVILLLTAYSSFAQGGVYRVGGGVTAPTLVRKQEPQYSEEARRARYQGSVQLYIEVDPEGNAINIKVQNGLAMGLNEKAIEAVQTWKFKPGTKDGQPVTVMATIIVNFNLLSHWVIARQEVSIPNSAVKPILHAWVYPPECEQTAAHVSLTVDVDSNGAVKAARVVESSDPRLGQDAVEAVLKWLFNRTGLSQPASGEIDLVCKP
jgi:TonB family protein